jgi:hypothetical protein
VKGDGVKEEAGGEEGGEEEEGDEDIEEEEEEHVRVVRLCTTGLVIKNNYTT